MDAQPLGSERTRELAQLRTRAYGPGADIHLDADALARLVELERLARPRPEEPADRDFGPVPRLAAGADLAAGEQTSPKPPAAATDSASAGRPHRRRFPLWLAVTAAAVTGVLLGIGALVAAQPQPDAVLRVVPAGEARVDFAMYGVDVDAPARHAPFHGLEVWSGRTPTGTRCVLVTMATGEWMASGCAPAPLPAVADITFFPGMRPVDGLELPPGSVLRFELRDGVVHVRIAEAEEPA